MIRKTPAEEQFKALGLSPKDYTPAMKLAIKQKWSGLPVDEKVDVLRGRLAAVTLEQTPTAEVLQAQGMSEDDARAEAARLKRNATVTRWRTRNQLQAALDARDLRFKSLRAKRSGVPAQKGKPVAESKAGAA